MNTAETKVRRYRIERRSKRRRRYTLLGVIYAPSLFTATAEAVQRWRGLLRDDQLRWRIYPA